MFKKSANRANKAKQQQSPVFKQNYFENCHKTYSCIHCRAHLANHDELISKLFQGNHGRAYLFNKVVNVGCKQAVQRELLTGPHAVADIYCDSCETTLGWKYEQAFVPSQKYKEGKYIIELVHMLKENNWDLTSYNAREPQDKTVKPYRDNLDAGGHFRVGDPDVGLNYSSRINNSVEERKSRINIENSLDVEKLMEEKPGLRDLEAPLVEESLHTKPQTPPTGPFGSQQSIQCGTIGLDEDTIYGIELMERSPNRIQIDSSDLYRGSSRGLSVSPKNSLCSRSQSDMSSSTGGNSTDEATSR